MYRLSRGRTLSHHWCAPGSRMSTARAACPGFLECANAQARRNRASSCARLVSSLESDVLAVAARGCEWDGGDQTGAWGRDGTRGRKTRRARARSGARGNRTFRVEPLGVGDHRGVSLR
uniref:Uncharacterized protein n=1 Tax=Micromonas pusilla TaxID=38833 RepID=A0A7S0KBV1_MICPS